MENEISTDKHNSSYQCSLDPVGPEGKNDENGKLLARCLSFLVRNASRASRFSAQFDMHGSSIAGLIVPQQRSGKMSISTVNIHYHDGSIASVGVREKMQVIDSLKKLAEGGWMVIKNQTFLDDTVQQRDIEHNNAVKQLLRVDEGTYLPKRFRIRTISPDESLWVRPNKISSLQIIYAVHLGGEVEEKWKFRYLPSNESSVREVTVNGTDIILIAGWMTWKMPCPDRQPNDLQMAEIIYAQQRPFH